MGRWVTSFCSFFLNACFFVLLGTLKDIRFLLPIFMLRGSLANATGPLDKSILTDYTPSTKRGFWNAIESFNSMTWSGSAFIGGIISDKGDYQRTFWVTGYIYFGVCFLYLPLLWLVPKNPNTAGWIRGPTESSSDTTARPTESTRASGNTAGSVNRSSSENSDDPMNRSAKGSTSVTGSRNLSGTGVSPARTTTGNENSADNQV